MARLTRVVVPGYPHHIIQRGNRRQAVFFSDDDKTFYIEQLIQYAITAGITFWAYCLMDNHVHFIAVPDYSNSFARGLGEAHRRYTRMVNFRENWRGYLWQGRFLSYTLSEKHLYSAIRYVERNPVRAGLVERAEDYPWSSAKAHILKKKDKLTSDNYMLTKIDNWSFYLAEEVEKTEIELFKKHALTGRPLGNMKFLSKLEELTGRNLRKGKPGPKIRIK